MPPGAETVRYEPARKVGNETVDLHVYAVSKNRPWKTDEVGSYTSVATFHLDIFTVAANGTRTFRHRVVYKDEVPPTVINVKWLRPNERKAPILLLEGGFTHWKRWIVATFPQDFTGKQKAVQEFLWGGEDATYILQSFDTTDKRGYLKIVQITADDANSTKETLTYTWNGTRFAVSDSPYFVIAASVKDEKEAYNYIKKNQLKRAEVLPTGEFTNLKSGLFIVVVGRSKSLATAQALAKGFQASGKDCYVKRAY